MFTLAPAPQLILLMSGVFGMYISKRRMSRILDPESLFMMCFLNTISILSVVSGILILYKWMTIESGYDWSFGLTAMIHPISLWILMMVSMFVNASILFKKVSDPNHFDAGPLAVHQMVRLITILIPAFFLAQLV